MKKLRAYNSEPTLTKIHVGKINTTSEVNLRRSSIRDSQEISEQYTYGEYLFAAETLENIVNNGTYIGNPKAKLGSNDLVRRELNDKVLKLVYGAMKYLPHLDTILVKTQFLVFNNRFLDSLGLVKVMLFELMKHHFDFKHFPGVDYASDSTIEEINTPSRLPVVKDLEEAFQEFSVKLGAAYARLRIDKGARGETSAEQMSNILPQSVRDKEEMAVEISKTMRINLRKTTKEKLVQKFVDLDINLLMDRVDPNVRCDLDSLVYLDSDFDDLLVLPPSLFDKVKSGPLVSEGDLIYQDKATMYGPLQMKTSVTLGDHIIDARAGCGTKIGQLSDLVGKKGCIYAFEHRAARLETLKAHILLYNYSNVKIVEEDFQICNHFDPRFAEVTSVVVEPVNSGTTIIDKLGYMLQEEEYPVDQITQKDLYSLKRQQILFLKQAFKFPKVNNILYTTRSVNSEENEEVVQEVLDRYGVQWRLNCVLPEIPSDKEWGDGLLIEECLTILPSEVSGNGIFLANFQLRPMVREIHRCVDQTLTGDLIMYGPENEVEQIRKVRKKVMGRQRGERLKIRLPKLLRASVDRLSVPRLYGLDKTLFGSLNDMIKVRSRGDLPTKFTYHSQGALPNSMIWR